MKFPELWLLFWMLVIIIIVVLTYLYKSYVSDENILNDIKNEGKYTEEEINQYYAKIKR